jgi:hypothetical protein
VREIGGALVKNHYIKRVEVNGDTAINPYWYLRDGLLHVRYTVDRCVRLSPSEELKLKEEITANPSYKQDTLEHNWKLLTDCVGKEIVNDGIAEAERQYGHKN